MGIRFRCPQCGKKIHVKDFLAGKRGICPRCEAGVEIPLVSQLPPSLKKKSRSRSGDRIGGATKTSAPRAPMGRLVGESEYPTIDPLDENPGRRWFIRSADGRELGPLAPVEVRQLMEIGGIQATTSVKRDDWPERLVAAAVWPLWKGIDPFAGAPTANDGGMVDDSPPADSAAPDTGLYYSGGSTAGYAAIVISIVVGAVLAVAAYLYVFDPPAWLRPQ